MNEYVVEYGHLGLYARWLIVAPSPTQARRYFIDRSGLKTGTITARVATDADRDWPPDKH